MTEKSERDTGEALRDENGRTWPDGAQKPDEGRPLKRYDLVYLRVWINLFNYRGKTRRKEYWTDFVIHVLLTAAIAFLGCWVVGFEEKSAEKNCVILFSVLFFVLPYLSMSARRLKDAGCPWFLPLLWVAPFVGIVVFMLCFLKSREEYASDKEFKKAINKLAISLVIIVFLLPVALFVIVLELGVKEGTDLKYYGVWKKYLGYDIYDVNSEMCIFPDTCPEKVNGFYYYFGNRQGFSAGYYRFYLDYTLGEEEYRARKAEIAGYMYMPGEGGNYASPIRDTEHFGFEAYIFRWSDDGRHSEYALFDDENRRIFCVYTMYCEIGEIIGKAHKMYPEEEWPTTDGILPSSLKTEELIPAGYINYINGPDYARNSYEGFNVYRELKEPPLTIGDKS